MYALIKPFLNLYFIIYCLTLFFLLYKAWKKIEGEDCRLFYVGFYFFLSLEEFFWLEIYYNMTFNVFSLLFMDAFTRRIAFYMLIFCFYRVVITFWIISRSEQTASWLNYYVQNIFYIFFYKLGISYYDFNKVYLKIFNEYWFCLQFDKRLIFRYKLFLFISSIIRIILKILLYVFILFIFYIYFFSSFFYYLLLLKAIARDNHIFLIFVPFILKLFYSIFFPFNKMEQFFFFFKPFDSLNISLVDTYNTTRLMYLKKLLANKLDSFFYNPLKISVSLLGLRKYHYVAFSKKSHWITFDNLELINRRYLIPFSWVSYENIILDDKVNTYYYNFKIFFFKWSSLIVNKSFIGYKMHEFDEVDDFNLISLSKFYEHDLKNNFSDKLIWDLWI